QIAALGHPIVGDHMYGGRPFRRQEPGGGDFTFTRQALDAAQITFVHPVTLQNMTLTAPLPADMNALLSILRRTDVYDNGSAGEPGALHVRPAAAVLTFDPHGVFR